MLGALCIADKDYSVLDQKLKDLRVEPFGSLELVLHTAEITRPSKSKDTLNAKFDDPSFRRCFYKRINALIEESHFSLITCVIKKDKLHIQDGANAIDPYIYSLNVLLDRILTRCYDQSCRIYPEKRDRVENIKIELEYLRAKNAGTAHFTGAQVSEIVEEFVLKDKSANISGLRLINLIVFPIGRHVLGLRKKKAGNDVSYKSIENKLSPDDFIIYP